MPIDLNGLLETVHDVKRVAFGHLRGGDTILLGDRWYEVLYREPRAGATGYSYIAVDGRLLPLNHPDMFYLTNNALEARNGALVDTRLGPAHRA